MAASGWLWESKAEEKSTDGETLAAELEAKSPEDRIRYCKTIFASEHGMVEKNAFFKKYNKDYGDTPYTPTASYLLSFTHFVATMQKESKDCASIIDKATKQILDDADSRPFHILCALEELRKNVYDPLINKNQKGTVRTNIEEIFSLYKMPLDKKNFYRIIETLGHALRYLHIYKRQRYLSDSPRAKSVRSATL